MRFPATNVRWPLSRRASAARRTATTKSSLVVHPPPSGGVAVSARFRYRTRKSWPVLGQRNPTLLACPWPRTSHFCGVPPRLCRRGHGAPGAAVHARAAPRLTWDRLGALRAVLGHPWGSPDGKSGHVARVHGGGGTRSAPKNARKFREPPQPRLTFAVRSGRCSPGFAVERPPSRGRSTVRPSAP